MSHILISEDELHAGTSLFFSSHGADDAGSNTVALVKMVSQERAYHVSRLLNSVLVKMFHMSPHRFLPVFPMLGKTPKLWRV